MNYMDNEEIEIKVLMEAVRLRYGYDFSQYAGASLTRRVKKCMSDAGVKNISDMIPHIIHDKRFFSSFLYNLSVNVTEMFRDPKFFLSLRTKVMPYLKTFPFIKVWSVGVSTGEEVYSLAIVLKEEGLYEKSLIYATDFNDIVLKTAQKGIYSGDDIKKSTLNYQRAGGKKSFGTYYHADYDSVIIDRSLKKNIVFANYNLATDNVFGEMNLIFCRNVLIYFNKDLQERVLKLFKTSLCNHGFLCLGSRETIDFSDISYFFVPVVKKQRIFQKKIKTCPGEKR
ncbi:CheR: chemotaxis protein methyltransferase [Desulfobacula toluolica Tol2]|uniref:CheR: chemotaxis protein methyltransferase n=1 Tax=Desulfobacula toluolica (strain DSM 7467 / Tol2) TaxID=651182 RepID=K0NEU8_DESTT|nr:CheR: chemotaxis protein methyltransferase [Desulfobacula toluolica Tol2]